MSLFLTNFAGWVLLDADFLFNLNAGVLLMTTVLTAAAVVSRWHDAPIIPYFAGLFVAYRLMEYDDFPWITANPRAASICALCVIPVIIYGLLLVFERAVQDGTLERKGFR